MQIKKQQQICYTINIKQKFKNTGKNNMSNITREMSKTMWRQMCIIINVFCIFQKRWTKIIKSAKI